jgi:superfamily II DNA or RNA helicase
LAKKRRIMLFCDDLFALKLYEKLLTQILGRTVPSVHGSTDTESRQRTVANFRKASEGDVVLFSKYAFVT